MFAAVSSSFSSLRRFAGNALKANNITRVEEAAQQKITTLRLFKLTLSLTRVYFKPFNYASIKRLSHGTNETRIRLLHRLITCTTSM